MSRAIKKYLDFHQQEPVKVGTFHRDLEHRLRDGRVFEVGPAIHVLYRSDKLNPETLEDEGWIDYIHDHKGGVRVYRADRAAAELGPERIVPAYVRNATELTWLGYCLGFAYEGDDREVNAKGKHPLPELFCTPNGRALLVIQGKRSLLAVIWGGKLGVEPRGIVN